MRNSTLTEIMKYNNEDILSRFTDLFNVSEEEAGDIFTETKKFLYISGLPGVFIPDELLIIDEMWHNFILFTQEYQQFCAFYFGSYLHHSPATKAAKQLHQQSIMTNLEDARANFNKKLTALLSVTYEQLGQDTVAKWFQVYPAKYSKEVIRKLRKN
jgi:hypothetical protein